jgi:hypothetical protein
MTSFIDEVRAMQTFKRKRNHREQVKRESKKKYKRTNIKYGRRYRVHCLQLRRLAVEGINEK